MKKTQKNIKREIFAIKVGQWLREWEKVRFDEKAHRKNPDQYFFLFTLSAKDLKALSGIYRRTTKGYPRRSEDLGIQRRHDKERSIKIRDFIQYGYPWSDLSVAKRKSGKFNDLRKPGWLPTAIVINILKSSDKRRGKKVDKQDLISVIDYDDQMSIIKLPKTFTDYRWRPRELHPIEVIDGQHRLWAFEDVNIEDKFELPVVAFHGLDISWQAYLFWSINITPKRINPSLAFDLYPLLRTEDWLDRFEGHSIYRETRAQELTEALWSHPMSPWHQRINMLGEPGLKQKFVSQAAWIRSLMATYIKAFDGKRVSIGGLFGAQIGRDKEVLPWSRAQQAAFLIVMGQKIRDGIKNCKKPWAQILRSSDNTINSTNDDPAFLGAHTLLNTDQGIRGILYITNDLCYIQLKKLNLIGWAREEDAGAADEDAVNKAIISLKKQPVSNFLKNIAEHISSWDWRSSTAEGLSEEERTLKLAFRGSGGYKELRRQLLKHLSSQKGEIAESANKILEILGYENK